MRSQPLFTLLISSILFFNSCNKQNDETRMNMNLSPTPVDFIIPANDNITGSISLGEVPLTVELDNLIKAQNSRFSINNIEQIRLTSVTLTLSDDIIDGNSFSNVENMTVVMEANGLPRTPTLASVSTPDAPATSRIGTLNIPVTATDNNLQNYVVAGQTKLFFSGRIRRPITPALNAKLSVTFRASLKL
jgi:hypothetical protein